MDFSRKQYFLFDMDGTLADSMWLWDSFLKTFLERYQKETDAEAQDKFDNLPLKDSAEYIALRYGLPLSGEAVFRQWTTEIRHMYQKEIPLKQGAAKYLYYLKSSGKKTALVTFNNKELAVGCMGNNHVLELFDALVCGDEMAIDKSDPEYYRYALRQIGGRAEEAVLFEDTYKTLMTAKKVLIDTVIVEDSSSKSDKDILMIKADLYIKNFENQILYR